METVVQGERDRAERRTRAADRRRGGDRIRAPRLRPTWKQPGTRVAGTRSERIETSEGGNVFRYCVDEKGRACVMRCESRAAAVRIPDALGGYPVVELAERSFSGLTNATAVVCPRHLEHIGAQAFSGCARLADVSLNEGLCSIGEEAFSLCGSLAEIVLPASVRMLGANLSGACGDRHASASLAAVRVASGNESLLVDEDGVIYAREEAACLLGCASCSREAGGFVLVDASRFTGSALVVREGTVRIGARAVSRNRTISKVVLPNGLIEIGEGAFRGCPRLVEAELPESLETIRAAAFSCTALRSVYLPQRCVNVEPGALCTGPVFPGSSKHTFSSALREIGVHPENPAYCLCGQVLCRRLGEGGRLKAVLATGSVAEASLPPEVVRVGSSTFAGTSRIGTLRLHDAIEYAEAPGLVPHGACERIVVEFSEPREGFSSVTLEIPEGGAGKSLLASTLAESGGRLDVERLVSAYDEALLMIDDRLGQARRMASRLAAPLYLAKRFRGEFVRALEGAFESVCLHFGARNYWAGFDDLADAGLLDARAIPGIVGKLSATGNAVAAGYLLDLKRRRFGEAALDYGI